MKSYDNPLHNILPSQRSVTMLYWNTAEGETDRTRLRRKLL
jgi:hypothetical protein